MARPLHEIARDIVLDWENPHPVAASYLGAMGNLTSMQDRGRTDDAESIVRLFLTSAGKWRGPTAAALKRELRRMLGDPRRTSADRVARSWTTLQGPPNLREAGDRSQSCASCLAFCPISKSCDDYSQFPVEPSLTCDTWHS